MRSITPAARPAICGTVAGQNFSECCTFVYNKRGTVHKSRTAYYIFLEEHNMTEEMAREMLSKLTYEEKLALNELLSALAQSR